MLSDMATSQVGALSRENVERSFWFAGYPARQLRLPVKLDKIRPEDVAPSGGAPDEGE
jgi:hypothetical protein